MKIIVLCQIIWLTTQRTELTLTGSEDYSSNYHERVIFPNFPSGILQIS